MHQKKILRMQIWLVLSNVVLLYVTRYVTRVQNKGNGSLKSYRIGLIHFRNTDSEKWSDKITVVYRNHFLI